MMFPSVFGENLFDDWMDDFGFRDNFFSGKNPLYGKHAKNIMKTDVRETDKGYELDVDLPGFKKDEVQVQLKDGYLTISAAKGLDKDEQDKRGNYIRRERYAGSTSRSFYVGDGVKNDEVQVQLKDGYLTISAAKGLDKDEEDKKGNYIRRERYAGSTSRSFYVGNGVKNEDVHAKFENGVLRLSVPKKAAEEIEADKYVSIEG